MKIIVTLRSESTKEMVFEGNTSIFGNADYSKSRDKRLDSIGFWLTDWCYAKHSGPVKKGQIFIPWTSILLKEVE